MPTTAESIDTTRSRLREVMPITQNWAYFDHAAVAPISGPAADALQQWLDEAALHGDTRWLDWAKKLAACRTHAANLVQADESEIALVPNTTAGINLIAEGLQWQPDDNVVILEDEFPANVYPWLNLEKLGVETRRVPTVDGCVDLNQLAELCDQRTRVVSISWVGYANGFRRNLKSIADIAHQHEALFFVDAIQGFGIFPLDVNDVGVDAFSADGHKWLLGPEGAGIAYLSQSTLSQLKPINVGWNSVKHASDFSRIEFNLKSSAERYEGGSHNMAGFIALGASLELFISLGVENIAAAILDFNDLACSQLEQLGATIFSPRAGEERSGIISFSLPNLDPNRVRKHCLRNGVALNCRAGRLRVSAHAYNNQDDLGKLINVLQTVPK